MEYKSSLILTHEATLSSLSASVVWLNTKREQTLTIDSILNQPNITLINQTTESIKIETIRTLKEQLAYSAYETGKTRYFVFLDAHLLTIPAQNALLKSIEEPPTNTQLVLVTKTPEKLLSTILSRCQIISVKNPNDTTKNKHLADTEIAALFFEIIQSSPGKKITLASAYKERTDALTLCTKLLQFQHAQLSATQTKQSTQQITQNLKILLATVQYLEQNVNVSLALENCFFQLT